VKLTEKQKAFCDYYIESLNATESYKRAYGCNNDATARTEGSKNLAKPNIKKYIDDKMKQIEEDRIADAKEVLRYLTKGMRQELEEEVVVMVNTGDYTSEPQIIKKKISIKDANKCAELLGKRYSLFTEKVDLNGNVGVTIIDDIGSLEDE
jgi:phage terminase small subunit